MSSFSAPTDPRYTRFAEGMRSHLAGDDSPRRWRWHPLDGKWYSYPQADFILEDVGLPPTPTPAKLEFEQTGAGWHQVYRVDSPPPPFGEDTAFVDLFRQLDSAFARFSARVPHAVWNSRSGEWRGALARKPGTGGTGDDDGDGLPEEAKKRIARVRDAERLEYITHDKAAELIADIVAEYT